MTWIWIAAGAFLVIAGLSWYTRDWFGPTGPK